MSISQGDPAALVASPFAATLYALLGIATLLTVVGRRQVARRRRSAVPTPQGEPTGRHG